VNVKQLILLQIFLFFLTNCAQEEKLGSSWHFDTKILRNPKITKQKLLQEGFEEISFKSTNNINIIGLLLERKDAKYTIIFSHGFCNHKEIFAPFVKLAPEYCNLLFLDLRSRGESEGPSFLSRVFFYGKTDYQDVINAIKFVNKKIPDKPIIVFGWCSGAFNSATALIHLEDDLGKLNVKGLVFDSGFGSVIEMSHVPTIYLETRYVPGCILKLYSNDKQRAKKSYLCALYVFCLKNLFHMVLPLAKLSIRKREPETNLYDKIQNLEIPVLVIHAQDDNYAPWKKAQKLIERIKQKDLWIIESGRSQHSRNHLYLKEEYKQNMHKWLEKVIQEKK